MRRYFSLISIFLYCLCLVAYAQAPSTQPVVREIRVEGLTRLDAEVVLKEIHQAKNSPLDRAQLRDDIAAIYALGGISDIQVLLEGDTLIFRLEEQPILTSLRLTGNRKISIKKLKKVLPAEKSELFSPILLKNRAETLLQYYQEKGFAYATISATTEKNADNTLTAVYKINEGNRVFVQNVRFTGNHNLSSNTLRRVMQTRKRNVLSVLLPIGRYRSVVLEKDLLAIQALYLENGFLETKVRTPKILPNNDRSRVEIVIPIEEGERFFVGKISFSGELLESSDELRKRAALQEGKIFRRSALASDLRRLENSLKDLGYAFANVVPETKVDRERRRVHVTFQLSKGNLVRINRIEILGNKRTSDRIIRQEMSIAEGELYSQSAIDRSRKAITRLGFFDQVSIQSQSTEDPTRINIIVDLRERRTGNLQVGSGYSARDGIVGTVQLAEQNLFGRGQTLQLQGQLSRERQLINLRFVEPRLVGSLVSLSLDTFVTSVPIEGANRDSQGGRVLFGYRFTDELRISAGYSIENVNIGATAERLALLPESLKQFGLTSSLLASVSYDSRDNRFFPSRGLVASTTGEVSDEILGASLAFVRGTASVSQYIPIGAQGFLPNQGTVLKLLARGSGIASTNEGQEVPFTERYFLGGIGSVRGFGQLSLGPSLQLASGDVVNIGGTSNVVISTEIEFPLFRDLGIRGLVFADAGNAFGGISTLGVGDVLLPIEKDFGFLPLRTSVGFGLRWYTPISPAPFRFEFGFPLDAKSDEAPSQFHFAFGNEF